MRPVTDSFLNAIRGSHTAVFRARLVEPGTVGVNPNGTQINILSGNVVFDTNAKITSSLDLVTDLEWPGTPDSPGNPYGQEIYVERGVRYGAGTPEYVGLGYFRIDTVEQQRAPKGTLRITGSDRMANVVDGRPIQPVQFSAGASIGSVLDLVVGQVVPGLVSVYDFDAYSELLRANYVMTDDRIKFVQELLDAYGKIGYFDYAGRLQVRDVPDPTNTPVWDIDSGRSGVLVSLGRSVSRAGVYNGVVATGEPVGELEPVRGYAFDLDPASPTYWEGPFGKVPRFFSSPFLTTNGQCGNTARALLLQSTGLPYEVVLESVPNPALEGWDVVRVKYGPHNVETHILSRIKYDLSAQGTMQIETRKQYLI